MMAVTPQEIPAEDKDIDFLKKLIAKILRRNIIVAAAISIVIVIGFCIFANNYELPLPFDTYRMSVELVPHAVVTGEDGKTSWVVYYYYSKTLWTSLFVDPDLQEYSESGMSTGTDMYGDGFDSADYEPQMIEVYYLPVKELYDRMDSLSDEEYDKLRENSMLVWSGIA